MKNLSLDSQILEVMNKGFILGKIDDDKQNNIKLQKLNLLEKAPFLPIVNENNILNSILAIHDSSYSNTSVLIMAGGFGKRLGAHTENKPKPLVEVAGKPILKYILDKIFTSKITNINISVYYKPEKISDFINKNNLRKKVNIIYEKKPLGTIGALGLLEDKTYDSYLVINADVITDVAFNDIIIFHNDNKNDITIGAAIHEFEIPYGVIKYDELGKFYGISEKPSIKNLVSAGIYMISKESSLLIPKDKHMDMPDFIELVKVSGLKVGVFPVQEYWTDIGRPETLNKANNKFNKIG